MAPTESHTMITFARAACHDNCLAKVAHVWRGRIFALEPAPQAGLHRFRQVKVGSLAELMGAVEDAAGRGEFAVRAEPVAPVGRRAIYDNSGKGPAGLRVVPRPWVALDWDGVEIRPVDERLPDPLRDPEIGVAQVIQVLPAAFQNASVGWQVTASAGAKSGWRLRTWHWLDHPLTGAELKFWLGPAIARDLLDPVTLVECQPTYLSLTIIGDPDPCPRRFGILKAGRDAVAVPDLAGAMRSAALAARPRRPAVATGPLTQPNGHLEERLAACVAAVAGATKRHTTYKHEAARARALCDRYGVDWEPWKARLIEAYESTLTPAEIAQRKASSTHGIMEWLDQKASAS